MVLALPDDWRSMLRPLQAARVQGVRRSAVLEEAKNGLQVAIPRAPQSCASRDQRIEARLGGTEDDGTLYKPKWQRWGTFNRYCERLEPMTA